MNSSKVSVVSPSLVGERVGGCVTAGGETTGFSAAGPAATGTAHATDAALAAENGGALEVDPAADTNFCEQCGWVHQERERPVRCLRCHRHWTGNYHAICETCISRELS